MQINAEVDDNNKVHLHLLEYFYFGRLFFQEICLVYVESGSSVVCTLLGTPVKSNAMQNSSEHHAEQ